MNTPKLKLHKDVLRNLTTPELDVVIGGTVVPTGTPGTGRTDTTHVGSRICGDNSNNVCTNGCTLSQ